MSILQPLSFLGSVLFLFIFWKRLREDYSSELIFSSGAIFVTFISIGFLLSQLVSKLSVGTSYFIPAGLWFWGSATGFILAFLVIIKKYKLRPNETLEAAVVSAFSWLSVVYLLSAARVMLAIILFLFCAFYYFELSYKKFSWYKSGKKGFSGFAIGSIFFLFRSVASLAAPEMFSLIGKLDFVPSATTAFLLLFSLYNLSEDKNGR